jgi:hypothetical protein
MQINAFLLDIPVSNSIQPGSNGQSDAAAAPKRHPLVALLAALLFAEAAGIAAAAIYLVIEILTAPADSVVSAIALAVLVAIAAVWVGVIAVNVLRGKAWIRAASIVVQVLIAAIAVGSFQGASADPLVGVALIVPALLVLVLLFAPPVVAATSRRDD